MKKARIISAAAVVCVALTACGGSGTEGALQVFADATLADAYRALAAAFKDANPGVEVELTLDDSANLADSILAGTAADVFASADAADLAAVAGAGMATGPARTFGRDLLMLAVPWSNPAGIAGIADLADESLMIGLCASEYACGADALEALALAGVTASVDETAEGTRALLNQIEARELDAGIVYAIDVAAEAGYVEGIVIPEEYQAARDCQIAALTGGAEASAAEQFVAFVLSAECQEILASYGLVSP